MARDIYEIKNGLENDLMNNEDAAEVYGFELEDSFSSHFSKVSVESILFHIFAGGSSVIEHNFDQFKAEVLALCEEQRTPRLKWYRDKLLQFCKGLALIPETDVFDTEGMTEDEIEAARVVKHATALENDDQSILTLKVKGADGPLDEEVETQLLAYIKEFRPAGVKTVLVNTTGDLFNCVVNIAYDPMYLAEDVREACRAAIVNYIENLDFDGEYTNMELVNRLQKVAGVKIADFIEANYQPTNEQLPLVISSRCKPYAGWFTAQDINLKMSVYE